MTSNNCFRGSDWRKWDLQVQPIKDLWFNQLPTKHPQIKCATKEYIKNAIANQISVIGITDHNCGIAIDKALELVEEEGLDLVVLPGVEIDINGGYQILLIFNPAYKKKIKKPTWEETVNHFLNHVCSLPSPVIDKHGQAEAISSDINTILERICAEDIGIPIFAHSQTEKGLFKKTTPANRKKFFENQLERKYYFAVDHKTDAEISQTIDKLSDWSLDHSRFPLIKTSDAHQASEVGSVFTWIKAERTYEGLKQIIYDPQSRISVQNNKPVQPTNVIESISFDVPKGAKITIKQKTGKEKEEQFCFSGVKGSFCLSPFFNCLIGGRGSGKSTILNFLGQYSKDPVSSNAFWENEIRPSFDISDEHIFSFSGVGVFEFIGQSEVESFATNKEAFTTAIYERANILSDGLLEKDEAKLLRLLKKISAFRDVIRDIQALTDEVSNKEKERNVLISSIKITETKEYEEIVAQITNKSNQKQQLESWRTAIEELRSAIKELQQSSRSLANAAAMPNQGQPAGQSDDIALQYREAYEKARANIASATDVLDKMKFKHLVEKEEKLIEEIAQHEKELGQLLEKAGLSPENILQVKSAPQKLVRIDDELSKVRKKMEDKREELNKYPSVFADTQQTKLTYEKVIGDAIKPLVQTLEEQAKENAKQDIKSIGLDYFFDELSAWKGIADDFYKTFAAEYREAERGDLLKRYIVDNKEKFAEDQTKIEQFLSAQEKNAGYIRFLKDVFADTSNYQIFQTIRDEHLSNVPRYRRIQVLYDGKDIERASFGQKCTAVIVILLLFGNYPLIIDEPEAHLDSSLIANYLVPLIKKNKNNRQIIFATHNANFVINGDAEKIFILKNETGITEFIETTIEDLNNREELLKLEGGRDAFKKRGDKLRI